MGLLKSAALSLVLPLILSIGAFWLTQSSKRVAAWLDRQPAPVKQGIALGWAAALVALAELAGRSVCADGAATCAVDAVDWKLVLSSSWAGALALHGWRRKPRTP